MGGAAAAMIGQRILVLIPHPDDEAVGCTAAIGKARQQGARVFGALLTNGVPAPEMLWPWQRKSHIQRVRRRRLEARRAADVLGLEIESSQEIPTRTLKSALGGTHDLIQRLIRHLKIDMLWTPAYEGGHQDHDVTNFLASTFRSTLPVWEFSEYNSADGRARSQEFFSPNGNEKTIVLTHEEQRRKRAILSLYLSERANLSHIWTEKEVFRPLAEYDYAKPPHSGKLFYQRFQWVPFHPRVDMVKPEAVCRAIQEFRVVQESKPASRPAKAGVESVDD